MGYMGVSQNRGTPIFGNTHIGFFLRLLTFDPNFQRDIQVVDVCLMAWKTSTRFFGDILGAPDSQEQVVKDSQDRGHYMTPTQTMHYYRGKSFKFTIHLHYLIPLK